MDLYKKIIVAVDGSDVSNNAVEHAVALAKHNKGELTAIHVIPPIDATEIETFKQDSLLNKLQKEGEEILSGVRERAEKEGVAVRTSVEDGMPFEKICDIARNAGADLIVMGSHGRTGIEKVFIGSVTERVISGAPCPVLVVR